MCSLSDQITDERETDLLEHFFIEKFVIAAVVLVVVVITVIVVEVCCFCSLCCLLHFEKAIISSLFQLILGLLCMPYISSS